MKFLLYGAATHAWWLKFAAWALLVGSLPALRWWPLWLAMTSSGVALLLVASNIVVPDAQCVMCRRERAVVLSLMAGDHASVCDACSVTAAGLATRDQLARAASKSLWAMSVLHVMPELTPNAVSAPLLQLAWNLEGVDRDAVLEEAGRLHNPRVKVAFYEATKEDARSSTEWINLGVALNACGRFDEALAATRRATEALSEPWVLNNVAAITLRAGGGDLERLLADVKRARTLLVENKSDRWEAVLPAFINNQAELELRLGRATEALTLLDESAKSAPPNTRALLTRHAALTTLGRTDEAKAVAEQAKKQAHPDSLEAVETSALS